MIIGDRLKTLRQGDIEKRTGLLRCYISRVENGHTVPTVETLEKLARVLEVPMYQSFCDGNEPKLPHLTKRKSAEDTVWGSSARDGRQGWKLVMHVAQKMTRPKLDRSGGEQLIARAGV